MNNQTKNNDIIDSLREIVTKCVETKRCFIDGLKSIQKPEGGWPTIYPFDRTTHHWTTSQCFRTLLENKEYPQYYDEALQMLLRSKEGSGWRRGKADGLDYDNIYCTADAIMAFIVSRQFDKIKDSIKLIWHSRNNDYGWGIVVGDNESKVRSTAWAIDALLMAYNIPPLFRLMDKLIDYDKTFEKWLSESIEWLDNSRARDGGWGYSKNEIEGNISSTAVTIQTLLSAKEKGFYINENNIDYGLSILKKFCQKKTWIGAYETFDIFVNNEFVGRHRAFGDGAPMVLMCLIVASRHGFIPITDKSIFMTIDWILKCSKSYKGFKGKWMIPSSAGEMKPLVWDSAYAILSLNTFERFFIEYLVNSTEFLDRELGNEIIRIRKEHTLLKESIELAKKCKSEDDRIHPKVGVIIIKDDNVVCKVYRNEFGYGEHAEYIALERKCINIDLRSATLITTLEPCTTRNHPKISCTKRIIERGIKKVVIGMLDPYWRVHGKGELLLLKNDILVEHFPAELGKEIRALNNEFIKDQEKPFRE